MTKGPRLPIPLKDALRVRSAELWMQLGEPQQALEELEWLTERARRHPWAERVSAAAFVTSLAIGFRPYS